MKEMRGFILGFLVAGTSLLAVSLIQGGSSWSPDNSAPAASSAGPDYYEEGMQAIQKKNYKSALGLFKKAHRQDRRDPEVLNMLAYTHRRLGNLPESFEHYEKALQLKPRFPQARDYLGQAHLQAALAQVEILKGYGSEGKESLDELVGAIKAAAAQL